MYEWAWNVNLPNLLSLHYLFLFVFVQTGLRDFVTNVMK